MSPTVWRWDPAKQDRPSGPELRNYRLGHLSSLPNSEEGKKCSLYPGRGAEGCSTAERRQKEKRGGKIREQEVRDRKKEGKGQEGR